MGVGGAARSAPPTPGSLCRNLWVASLHRLQARVKEVSPCSPDGPAALVIWNASPFPRSANVLCGAVLALAGKTKPPAHLSGHSGVNCYQRRAE
eukprot:11221025-Alexandrium_andersonii.AAC.1